MLRIELGSVVCKASALIPIISAADFKFDINIPWEHAFCCLVMYLKINITHQQTLFCGAVKIILVCLRHWALISRLHACTIHFLKPFSWPFLAGVS